jgi:DOPA 4,5-dioxygenase
MSSEAPYPYPSPLSGKWAGLPELGEERTEDGKSLKNPTPTVKSEAYDSFTYPLSRGRDGGL